MRGLLLSCILLGLMGCAQLKHVDRSRVNHPAMDLNTSLVPAPKKYLTAMDVSGGGANATSCSVCAK